jgi:hypothetical protein
MNRTFQLHALNRDLTNLSLFRYRDWQGYLVTGQHSGTHWIKWMLSYALAAEYGVTPPKFYNNASSNEVIGHPKHRRPADWPVPRIASSHTIAPYELEWGWLRALAPLPPYGVVVRDVRDVLVSNYEKWKAKYDVPFAEYVKGDPLGKRFNCDVWWYIRFLNRWGAVQAKYPAQTLVLKYEDFRTDPRASLVRLLAQFGVTLSDASIDAGVAAGGKDFMARHHNPDVEVYGVRADSDDRHWDEQSTAILNGTLREHLKYDFGYGLLMRG